MGNYDFIKNFLGKSANLGKDVHDLSNREGYSAPFGTWLPVSYLKVVPNENYEVNIGAAVQTAPMREDNFARINNNMKAVFVPMSSLCRDYLSLTSAERTTRKDSLLEFPIYDLRFHLKDVLVVAASIYVLQQWFLGMRSTLSDKWDHLSIGYAQGDDSRLNLYYSDGSTPLTVINPSSLDGSNKYVDCLNNGMIVYNNVQFPTGSATPLQVFLEQMDNFVGLSGNLLSTDILRLLDNLGYGNFIPVIQNLADYRFSIPVNDPLNRGVYIFQSDNGSNFIVTAEFIAFLNSRNVEGSPFELPDSDVSLLPILAYQYYISLSELSNYRNPADTAVTLDAICNYKHNHSDWPEVSLDGDAYYLSLFDNMNNFVSSDFVHCVECGLDLRFGHDGLGHGDQFLQLFIHLFSLSNPLLQQDLFTTSQLSVVSGSVPGTTASDLTTNLIQTMNEVSALYKLRQDLLRAGVRRDKQMQSIFGVSGNQHVVEPVKILDSSSTPLNINGLVNMADTEVAPLGARGARGDGKNGLHFKARFEDFGFIFIVQSFTCDAFYENFMIDQSWQIGTDSWFMPHFNNLGLEPIRTKDLSIYDKSGSDLYHNLLHGNNAVLGFSSHYWRLKTRVDKLHGLFTNFAFLPSSESVVDFYTRYGEGKELRFGNAAFGGFLPSLIQQQVSLYEQDESLYYYPSMVNNLFVQMVNGTIFNDQSFDQFRCVISIGVKKISPMPKIGLFKLLVG